MHHLLPTENIVETKKCLISGKEFIITDKDLEFYDKISPIFGGKKFQIPTPNLCPEERMRRRLAWRNEYKLYKRKCDGSGKEIISVFRDDAPFPVYDAPYWWSDAWSAGDYGQEFDFEKTFFEQFGNLLLTVPQISRSVIQNQNSDYVNQAGWNKDCYLLFEGSHNERCYFSHCLNGSKSCLDMLYGIKCEFCFECIDCTQCYSTYFSQNCNNCNDCYFLKNCVGCRNCFGCTNLANREYYFLNQSCTKEEYEKKKQAASLHNRSELDSVQKHFKKQSETMSVRYYEGHKNENVSGDYLNECFNCHHCFDLFHCRDCRYCAYFQNGKSLYDVNVFGADKGGEMCLECHEIGDGVYGLAFCDQTFNNVKNSWYSKCCASGENMFGCMSMKKGKNTILNKSYSAQEYEILCGKIIDHMKETKEWGEFFPISMSPFGYNETVANEYFPMTQEELKEKGWKWYEGENKNTYMGQHYIPLPILEYDEKKVGFEVAQKNIDSVLGGIIQCEITRKPFKIIRQELAFYIENGIPLPTKHPDQRHKERMEIRNPRELHERKCDDCGCDIVTTYAPDRPEKVVCEECYRKLVY